MLKINEIDAWLDLVMKFILILFLVAIMSFFIFSLTLSNRNEPYAKYLSGSISLAGITGILKIYQKGFHKRNN